MMKWRRIRTAALVLWAFVLGAGLGYAVRDRGIPIPGLPTLPQVEAAEEGAPKALLNRLEWIRRVGIGGKIPPPPGKPEIQP